MVNFSELGQNTFIIAEVGQNHQGDFETALKYIQTFSQAGANAIKFQTRDNRHLFTDNAYCKPYDSMNSFGKTYGEHREVLELDPGKLHELAAECKNYDVKFMSTPFEEKSLERLLKSGVEVLKIASFDLGNLPLIKEIGNSRLPIVMSIGGGKFEHIKKSHDALVETENENLSVLHCVSEYPCSFDKLGLGNIPILKESFPKATIGLSDHFNGILSGPIAYMVGARVFEKHVTFDRALKGTDHSFALQLEGFRKFCRDINRVNKMVNLNSQSGIGEEPVFKKLGKTIAASCDIKKGQLLSLNHFRGVIDGVPTIPIREVSHFIGKRAAKSATINEILDYSFFE